MVFLLGVGLALVGMFYAGVYAWWRFGELRFPPVHRYPAGLLNSVRHRVHRRGDVARHPARAARSSRTGRSSTRSPSRPSCTRWRRGSASAGPAARLLLAGAGHRPRGRLADARDGRHRRAILLAHAVTRFAIFVATGHAGQVTPSAAFDERGGRGGQHGSTPAGLGGRRADGGRGPLSARHRGPLPAVAPDAGRALRPLPVLPVRSARTATSSSTPGAPRAGRTARSSVSSTRWSRRSSCVRGRAAPACSPASTSAAERRR